MWTQRLYFVFSFLLLTGLLMAVICAEVAAAPSPLRPTPSPALDLAYDLPTPPQVGVVLCYFQLRREDYRWWWRAFGNTATTGVYFFCYALYYSSELHLSGGVSRVLYFGYMGAAALGLGLMCGTVGLGAAYVFVVNVYAAVKVD